MREFRCATAAFLLLALVQGCQSVDPTQIACNADDGTFCPTGYCCGSGGFCAADGDHSCVAGSDAGVDAGPAGMDAGPSDAALSADAGEDAGNGEDGGVDAGPAARDAGPEAGGDAGTDAGNSEDAGSDAGLGAADAGEVDAGEPDAGFDGGAPDAGADAGPDAGPNVRDGGSGSMDAGINVCGDAGTSAPPSNLTYATNPAQYTKGTTITNDVPSNNGCEATAYAIGPALPTGLLFSTSTGVISGTPSALSPQTAYTVTASNVSGSTQVALHLTVVDVAPSLLHYLHNPVVYQKGAAIPENSPSVSGGPVVSYTLSPALPGGLTLDPTTGVISGTPNAVSPETTYTVTATNSGGSASVTLQITVNDVPPTELGYATNPLVATRGQAIAGDAPWWLGGFVTLWAIAPSLPQGLFFDVTTGIVSGTPSAVSPQTGYTVTATNSGGSAQATLVVTVNDVAPSSLSYATNPAVYTVQQPIASDVPSNQGGVVVLWGAPSLPVGLSVDMSTGVLSGTPVVVTPETGYAVTAMNSGGFTMVTLELTVNDVAPFGLIYTANPLVCTNGTTITPDVPNLGGGAVVTWAISPPLPTGLSFSLSDGTVSGTPTADAAQTVYTVTATNSGGSTSVGLTLSVTDGAPSNLSYSTNPASFTVGVLIPDDSPSSSGGSVTGYSISPALPAALSFNTTTGVVSGTPTSVTPEASYTVTASGPGGSTSVVLMIAVVTPSSTTGLTGALTAGDSHTCAVVGGGVQCWGYNAFGALGNDTTTNSRVPVRVEGISNGAQSVAGGAYHTCALVNGGVQCWGEGEAGELGNDSTTQSDVPVQVTALTGGVQAISVGGFVSCALVSGGARCWGDGIAGDLGNNSMSGSHVPVVVAGVNGAGVLEGVQAIAVGESYHSCALANGGVDCWGHNEEGELGNNSTADSAVPVQVSGLTSGVQAIAVGYFAACAMANGGAVCWGDNSDGELGNNSTMQSNVPVQVVASNGQAVTGVQGIGVGYFFACALVNGGVLCRGQGTYGSLGNNSTANSLVAVPVIGLTSGVQALAVGEGHSCALVNGGVQCWGSNDEGELGNNATPPQFDTPVQVSGLAEGLQQIAGGADSTCALVSGGVQCWGYNLYGALGNDSTVDSPVPVHVQGLTANVQAISFGDYAPCAVVNGGVQCWGQGTYGQLGNNSTANSSVPVQVSGLTGGAVAVAGGREHACALVNGGVECWGNNTYGQLGNGTTVTSTVPVAVSGVTGVQAIASGEDHTCALVNGGVECWGFGGSGQLGNNATASSSAPVVVLGLGGTGQLSGVEAITGADNGTCALVAGAVLCWGFNLDGELGNNLTTNSPVPVHVSGLTAGVQAVAAGADSVCAVMNGQAGCWGLNTYGMLGDSSTNGSLIPIAVTGLTSGVQSVASGVFQSCAIVNGAVQCWGDGNHDALGNGLTTNSLVPVPVSPWAD